MENVGNQIWKVKADRLEGMSSAWLLAWVDRDIWFRIMKQGQIPVKTHLKAQFALTDYSSTEHPHQE